MQKQHEAELMVGKTVYQVTFIDDIQDIILMSSLSKERVDDFVQSVRDYDQSFVKDSEHDLDGSYDANHPLAKWREEIASGGSLVQDIEHIEGGSWSYFFVRSEFPLS